MEKDQRYAAVKLLFEQGHIKKFEEIWKYIPMDLVARDLGHRPERFKKRFENLGLIKLDELYEIARLFKIDEKQFTYLVIGQVDLAPYLSKFLS